MTDAQRIQYDLAQVTLAWVGTLRQARTAMLKQVNLDFGDYDGARGATAGQ